MSSDERNGRQDTRELYLELAARDARVAYASAQRNARLMDSLNLDHVIIMDRLDIDSRVLHRMLAADGRLMDPGCAQDRHRGCAGLAWDETTRRETSCACECHE